MPSHKVSWNKTDPKYILLTSQNNSVYVIGVMDLPKCTQLMIQIEYTMPA
jgi:hypothetical protein